MSCGVQDKPVSLGQAVHGGEQSTLSGTRCSGWFCPARTPWRVLPSQNCTCAFNQLLSHWEAELLETSLAQLAHTGRRKLDIQCTPLLTLSPGWIPAVLQVSPKPSLPTGIHSSSCPGRNPCSSPPADPPISLSNHCWEEIQRLLLRRNQCFKTIFIPKQNKTKAKLSL